MSASDDERLSSLEGQVAALSAEVAELRARAASADERGHASSAGGIGGFRSFAAPPRHAPPPRPAPGAPLRAALGSSLSGEQVESWVGRYGTLALGGLTILMCVGALIKAAVDRGLLVPEVRIAAGALAAMALAAAGLWFRRRNEQRYGGVLLALALAVTDLVAWGAGPRLGLVPVWAALAVVDLAALGVGYLALRDRSEFLFTAATLGALVAPFVTSDGGGRPLVLLAYGAAVIAGALRAAPDPNWMRGFAAIVAGAAVYALAAAGLPGEVGWYGPFLIASFGGAVALAALLVGQAGWRGEMPRALLGVAMIGSIVEWDRFASSHAPARWGVSLALAAVTYAALGVRQLPVRMWGRSAVLLPLASLAVAFAGTADQQAAGGVVGVWVAFALAAWRGELGQDDPRRASIHLMTAGLLGTAAIVTAAWPSPLTLVAGLAGWGVMIAWLGRDDELGYPLAAVAVAIGGTALSALDQLASRGDFAYVPFFTRSSASAACAVAGAALSAWVLSAGSERVRALADRPIRFGVPIALAIGWGRMEVAGAHSADLAAFLLISYYAACGLGSIIAGRRLEIGRLRVAGLALALYAAAKAVGEATTIGSIGLRVGTYLAAGLFLLGAGYLYRRAGEGQGRLQ